VTGLAFHLIPHTHWDREWYRPRAHFLARLIPMLDSALATLAAEPRLTFLLDGQTVLLRDYLAVRPTAWPLVEKLARAGQLQVGPWYVLADELIPSGESHIRNLQLGQLDAGAFGGTLTTLYSPDAFGHPAVLPMLAREFGLGGIALWRGRAGEGDFFHWRAPDGATVPVYHLPAGGYETGMSLPSGAPGLRAAWQALRDELVARAASRHVAVFVGADHHPLRADLVALAAAIRELEPGTEVRISRLDEFLGLAAADAPETEAVTGELRAGYGHTWSLQGVHATRLPLKRMDSETTLLLEHQAEPLAALAARAGTMAPAPLLQVAWRAVLESQFHDTIAGTVHDDAAAEAEVRLRQAATIGRTLRDTALAVLAGVPDSPVSIESGAGTLALWNPRATQAGGVTVVEVTQFRSDVIVGPPDGRVARHAPHAGPASLEIAGSGPLQMQLLGSRSAVERIDSTERYPDADVVEVHRVALLVPPQPGLSVRAARPSASRASRHAVQGVQSQGRTLRNQHLKVTARDDGSVDVIGQNGVELTRALALEIQADAGDAYTVSARGSVQCLKGPVRWRSLADGPLMAALRGSWREADAEFHALLELRHEEQFLRIRFDINNHGTHRRIRARLPGGGAPCALAGAAFGYERRRRPAALQWDGEQTVFTAPAQRFVAAAGPQGGAALLVPGHLEYQLTADGDLLWTMLRSVGDLSLADLPERPGHAAWPTPLPGAQCLGSSSCSLALLPCTPLQADDPVLLARAWEAAFLGPHGAWYRGRRAGSPSAGQIELTGHGLVASSIKPALNGPGTVLRAYNLSQAEVRGTWHVTPAPAEAWRVRADETRTAPLEVTGEGIVFCAGPRELVTVWVR
jgi:alpha-mannosidase